MSNSRRGAIYDGHMARLFGRAVEQVPATPDLRLSTVVSRILSLVPESALIIAPGEKVLLASASARALGIVRDEKLVGEELVALVRHARKGFELVESRVEFKRGRLSSGTFELFDPEKHLLMKDEKEILDWVATVHPETTFCKKKCICGDSADLPYCDNTHKEVNKLKYKDN